jgi:DNA-binding response OmpR family regulator
VLEKIRRSRPDPLRVIMITANEGSRHRAYAEMLGVDDYIRKPFAMDRLLESVDRLLSSRIHGGRAGPDPKRPEVLFASKVDDDVGPQIVQLQIWARQEGFFHAIQGDSGSSHGGGRRHGRGMAAIA